MNKRRALTLMEVLVVIGVLAFLLAIVITVSQRSRGPHNTSYCLNNLRVLSLAWILYATDNDDRIVNGAAGIGRPNEPAWVGKDWADGYKEGGELDPNDQIEAIKTGALWPYVKNVRTYRCPMTMPEKMRTYSIVDSMNGTPQPGNSMGRGPSEIIDELIIKNTMQISSPGKRVVFIDVGRAAPDSFAVYYDKEQWWDPPPVRHGDGMNLSFADGHSEYWKWKGKETIKPGKTAERTPTRNHITPKTPKGKEDLHRLQEAVWGKSGYTPGAGD